MGQDLKLIRLSTEFTRSANTIAYTANKVVSDGATTTLIVTNPDGTVSYPLTVGSHYQIKTVGLTMNSSGTTNASFDLYMYTSGVTAIADAGSYQLSYNEKTIRIGKTSLVLATADTNSLAAETVNTDVNHVFKAAATTISFHLVATAGYTPTSSEKIYIKVMLIEING